MSCNHLRLHPIINSKPTLDKCQGVIIILVLLLCIHSGHTIFNHYINAVRYFLEHCSLLFVYYFYWLIPLQTQKLVVNINTIVTLPLSIRCSFQSTNLKFHAWWELDTQRFNINTVSALKPSAIQITLRELNTFPLLSAISYTHLSSCDSSRLTEKMEWWWSSPPRNISRVGTTVYPVPLQTESIELEWLVEGHTVICV